MFIGETVEQLAKQTPLKTAISCNDTNLSYLQLYDHIKKYQQYLTSILDTVAGKKIAFKLNNGADFLVLFLAISTGGGIAIPCDSKWSKSELLHVLQDCEPDLFISLEEIEGEYPKTITFKQFLNQKPNDSTETNFVNDKVNDKDLFYIGYTSGTTGQPKGYMRTHRSWNDSFKGSESVFNISQDDRIFVPGPLVHSHFLYAAIQALHIGASLTISEKFNNKEAWEVLIEKEISVLYVVPTMFAAISYEQKVATILKTIISAGAKWEPTLKKRVKILFPHAQVFEFYGASELSFVSFIDDEGAKRKPNSVGKPFPGVKVSIRKDDGSEAKIGEIGKIFVKSKQVFSGYVNDREATNKVLHGKWATVDDLGYRDEEGFITLVGREKNMIISGGLNIYPEEIEKVLLSRKEIYEVAVVGIEDSYWGEKVVAVIRWNESHRLSHKQLKEYCREQLSSYKCPRTFIEVNELPHTTSGKVARNKVIELVTDQKKDVVVCE